MIAVALKAGTRLRSEVCSTEVIVVRGTDADVTLRCGGAPMVGLDAGEPAGGKADPVGPTMLGKRYVSDELAVEILCTKAGEGALALGDELLHVKEAKPLPSSD